MAKIEQDEIARLNQANATGAGKIEWRKWGPYVSERQWGTVREDYSEKGDAWNFFPHDHARSRAYRWGEDGIAGFCDDKQRLCMSVALWNGKDAILKERLFGLNNQQGNHGEDCKELYYYLDAVPTYSYAHMLYKYPQGEYPYALLISENARRNRSLPEFELIDTGLFDQDRYFDIDVEYAKAAAEDILCRITVTNRGPEAAEIHVLPQIWFRNTWSWSHNAARPILERLGENVTVKNDKLGTYTLYFDNADEILFCENETNRAKVFGEPARPKTSKDGFHDYLINGDKRAVNFRHGTKTCGLFRRNIPAGKSHVIQFRLTHGRPSLGAFSDFDAIVADKKKQADAYYDHLQAKIDDEDVRRIQRQAYAGVLWSKQYYNYDVTDWLEGDPVANKPPASRHQGRNKDWRHANMGEIISMPDKWEYPWFAAWDWAFHLTTLANLDVEDAKQQLIQLAQCWYMHPNGQIPAYEWDFGDVNPPVQAWAAMRIYETERKLTGRGDHKFLERIFTKLLMNFTWWVNREDPDGHNLFEGGFLGMDNVGVFDRSSPPPVDGTLLQSDGTSWMGMYSLNMLRISIELAQENDAFEDIATKFFEHFLNIGGAMTNLGCKGLSLWDDQDNFFYDWLVMKDGKKHPLRLRSLVGIMPILGVEVIDLKRLENMPNFSERMDWYLRYRSKLAELVSHWDVPGSENTRLLSICRTFRLSSVLERMLDPEEFLSDFGIRSLSRFHLHNPYVFESGGFRSEVKYTPAESHDNLFGGNSNWRGPIWMPSNYLIIESLQKFHKYYDDGFRLECPHGSGNMMTLEQIADNIRTRMIAIFRRDKNGRRPVFGENEKFQTDPHFKDYIPFHEYFHGDTGRGLGASHQTGWTALVANMIEEVYSHAGKES